MRQIDRVYHVGEGSDCRNSMTISFPTTILYGWLWIVEKKMVGSCKSDRQSIIICHVW